jgi:CRP-like cAMP-binding protein
MKNMVSLRVLALVSNVVFVAYGVVESQLPSIVLNAALLPVNARRLWEIRKLTRDIAQAQSDSPVSQWLLPHMQRRTFKAGEVLFRKGDAADKLIYLAQGQLKLVESDKVLGTGELIGEIGVFSPEKARTQTVVCASDGELYEMTDEMIYRLYHQNPKLGFYLIRLLAAHLLNDIKAQAGRPAGV